YRATFHTDFAHVIKIWELRGMQAERQATVGATGALEKDGGGPADPMADLVDRMLVRELVENWVVFRDAGDWARFRTVWHEDGRMMATWCQAPVEGFIQANQQGWAK